MALHTLVYVKSGGQTGFARNFLQESGFFTPVWYAQTLTEASEFFESHNIQMVLVEEGIASSDIFSLMEMAGEAVSFIFFAGQRPVVAEIPPSGDLPESLRAITNESLISLVNKSGNWDETESAGAKSLSGEDSFFVKSESVIRRISLTDLVCVEAQKDYVLLHGKKDSFRVLSSMKHVEARLPTADFARIHRSFIIRLDLINEIEGELVTIYNFKIPIGPSYRQALLGRLNFI